MIDDPTGHRFSPYLELAQDSIELGCCHQIAQWWKARQGDQEQAQSKPCRRHLLVSEVSPDLSPGGFFDCTVEVRRVCPTPPLSKPAVQRCYKGFIMAKPPLFTSRITQPTLSSTLYTLPGVPPSSVAVFFNVKCGTTQGPLQR